MKCPSCGTEDPNIYVGFVKVECVNPSCPKYVPPKAKPWKDTLKEIVKDHATNNIITSYTKILKNQSPAPVPAHLLNRNVPVQQCSQKCVICGGNVSLLPDSDGECKLCQFPVIHPSITFMSIGRIISIDGYTRVTQTDNPRAVFLNFIPKLKYHGQGSESLCYDFMTGHEIYPNIKPQKWMKYTPGLLPFITRDIVLAEVVILRRNQDDTWSPDNFGRIGSTTHELKVYSLFRSTVYGMKIMIKYDKGDNRITDIFK